MKTFQRRLRSRTGLISTVAAVLLVFLFSRLGLWQLDRADEKNEILERQAQATALEPLESLQPDDAEHNVYRQVRLSGSFDFEHQFLLDNRTVGGQPGFDVITPFYLSDARVDDGYVLVNRGWLGHNGNRQVALQAELQVHGNLTLEGVITVPSRGFTLGSSVEDSGNSDWPQVIQFVDYETIASKLDKMAVTEAVVIAAPNQSFSYIHHWKPVASGAAKHLGYAFQWFAMLTTVLVLYFYLMARKN